MRIGCIGVTVLMWIRRSRRTFRSTKGCVLPGGIWSDVIIGWLPLDVTAWQIDGAPLELTIDTALASGNFELETEGELPLLNEMQEKGAIDWNTEKWGLRDIPLDETICTRERIEARKAPGALQADPYAPVTAIRPEFNADRPFRVALRRLEAAFKDERAQLHAWMEMTTRKPLRRGRKPLRRNFERFRVKNEQKRRLLEKYRRLFGWVERLPSFK